MEPITTQFNLEQEIARWQLSFSDSTLTADDLTELTGHLRDEIDQLKTQQLSEQEAWLIARHRMGTQQDIDKEFSKVNPDFTGARHWVMLFWGASLFMLLQTLVLVAPVIPKYIAHNRADGEIKGWISYTGLTQLMYILSIAVFLLALISFIKPAKMGTWFNNLLCKYGEVLSLLLIPTGLLASFFNYLTFCDKLLKGYTSIYPIELQRAAGLLGFILYGLLIGGTVYLTLRYRTKENLVFKSFSKNLNWAAAALIGIFLQLPVNYSYTGSYAITAAAICFAFGTAGWLTGGSKKPWLNLAAIQTGAMLNFIFAFCTNHDGRPFFTGSYLFTLFVLGVSSFIKYRQTQQIQAA